MHPHNPHNPHQAHHQPQQPQQPGFDPNQPVAYDQFGNPLYAHPQEQPQFVHMSRSVQPMQQDIPPEVQRLHEESTRRYPQLNLSKEEYIVSAVKRHPIGLLKIWSIALMLILAFMALIIGFFMNGGAQTASAFGDAGSFATIGTAVLVILIVMVLAGAFVATYVYNANRFFLTNESVIQEIQTSLFSKHEQTVSLANIEDASYKQGGILQSLLDYGTIRLSTEGDETTYRFTYVSRPKRHIATLNNAVESFKNGRPVPLPNDD